MKLYLARKQNGLYQLTALQPIKTTIIGTSLMDVFVQPGDPINFQGLCPFSVKKLFDRELELLEVVRVRLTAINLPQKVKLNA